MNEEIFKFDKYKVNRDYIESRCKFRKAVEHAVALSVHIQGTPSTHGRQYWSSILFTKLTITSMTIERICLNINKSKINNVWDMSAIAMLIRALSENYLLMYWLCTQTGNEILWNYRINLLTLVDNRSRYRMTNDLIDNHDSTEFLDAQDKIISNLAKMPLFTSLPEKRQRELIKADRLPFIQDDVIDSLPVDKKVFRSLYRYLSAFVHTGTISFFRMEEHRRGNGEKNDYEMAAISGALGLATIVLNRAIDDMNEIHL